MVDAGSENPRVLMVATGRWVSTARLAMALRGLGCRVELMALGAHPARVLTGVFDRAYRYNPLWPLNGLRRVLRESKPDAVIAADELAMMLLGELQAEFPALLERSIGGAHAIAMGKSRMDLLRIAQEEGVAVPETLTVAGEGDLDRAIETFGFPLVLKADATSGGQGVRVVGNGKDARHGWKLLHGAPSILRALKRGFVDREWTHLRPWAQRTTRGVTAQRFVGGKERTGMAVCREGEICAFACLEVVEHWCERGPSSVLKVIRDAAMERAMRRVVRRIGATGFRGFDFIVGQDGTPLMIEMNPRPTQLVHLALGPGSDLVAAYAREVLGMTAMQDRERLVCGDTIAVFPQEIQRDPESAWLREGYSDVPWESPDLVRRVLRRVPAVLTEDSRWQGSRSNGLGE